MTNEHNPPGEVRSSDQLGLPLEEALKMAYYYTEGGEWRGPEVDEWDRWHAAAKVAMTSERQRFSSMLEDAMALEGFGCACEPAFKCGTCQARDTAKKVLGPLLRTLRPNA